RKSQSNLACGHERYVSEMYLDLNYDTHAQHNVEEDEQADVEPAQSPSPSERYGDRDSRYRQQHAEVHRDLHPDAALTVDSGFLPSRGRRTIGVRWPIYRCRHVSFTSLSAFAHPRKQIGSPYLRFRRLRYSDCHVVGQGGTLTTSPPHALQPSPPAHTAAGGTAPDTARHTAYPGSAVLMPHR